MKRAATIFILALVCAIAPARGHSPVVDVPRKDLRGWVEYYDQRYGLTDPFEKRTDNHGEGFEDLYGTRNFRVILKGVAYRGGANNTWNRKGSRDNRNPLPTVGLENLCLEGFGSSYYLYTTNFESAPRRITCHAPGDLQHTLDYHQISAVDEEQTRLVVQAIYGAIKDYRDGPIYLHCWNGWHASGLIAAKILRQFCGWSADEAVEYWNRNTDGFDRGSRYDRIRQRIRDFTPYPEFAITDDEAALICP